MTGAFTLAGWHFSRNPTSSSSENKIMKASDSEPWKTGSDAKYQYHPGGDTSRGRKDAPSALNEVVIPNVNLPKVSQIQAYSKEKGRDGIRRIRKRMRAWRERRCSGNQMKGCMLIFSKIQSLHEKYNKWGKDGY